MPLSDRDYMKGEHPPTCTCVDCVNKRMKKLGIKQHKKDQRGKDKLGDKERNKLINKAQKEAINREIRRKIGEDNKPKGWIPNVEIKDNPQTTANPPIKINSSHEFHPVTDTQIKTGRQYSPAVNVISNIIIVLIVFSILGLLGGGIYAVAKYHGNAFHWVAQEYHSLANGAVNLKDKTAKSASNIAHDVSNSMQSFNNAYKQTTTTIPNQINTNLVTSTPPNNNQATTTPTPTRFTPSTSQLTSTQSTNNIDTKTGTYKNYYLGLVNAGGFLSGDGCYDDTGKFIVLINNKNAANPTYSQLVSFLQNDKTDEFPYTYTNPLLGFYYGTAESHVDLTRIKNIIDGTAQPSNPDVCADFAERLHNDAEFAGIRCAYVSIDLSGYPDPYHYGISSNVGHALDAFQTVDRGLVYIDDTNNPGPTRSVTTENVAVGQQYVPVSLFPEAGWQSTYETMGTVTDIDVVWDGTWAE